MTAFYMVINNTYCLHIGIYNCTAYKFETMLFQILADFIRKGCSCRYVTFSIKMIFNRLIIDHMKESKLPYSFCIFMNCCALMIADLIFNLLRIIFSFFIKSSIFVSS